jgi:probable addiction module antidote protein
MAKTRPFDAAEYLDSLEAIAAYLSEALETNDASYIPDANGTVVRALRSTEETDQVGQK